MPTIDIKKRDLDGLIRTKITVSELERHLMLAKAELKDYNPDTDDLKIELSDSNRPDLWSAEGVARQIRFALTGRPETYPFFRHDGKGIRKINVSRDMKSVRPFIAACTARGIVMNEDILAQMIQSQDKLSEIFGRKRATVSIGIYELDRITFPIEYKLVDPHDPKNAFTPLGMEQKMTPAEIIERHPKGIAYGDIVKHHPKWPILMDSMGRVLSFPPIINSREIGEVKPSTKNVLIEVTGTDLGMIALTLNILAISLYDRGAVIEPIEVAYPYKTNLGMSAVFPVDISREITIKLAGFADLLGEDVSFADVKRRLAAYGYKVSPARGAVKVMVPPYRDDIMHPVDVIEDYAVSRGYYSFTPVMPHEFTVGAVSDIELLSDKVRTHMVGAGFQEIMSNILGAREDMDDILAEGDRFVEVANPMSLAYSVLRNMVIPSLLRVESASSKAFYPHRIFEVGEIAIMDPDHIMGSRTELNLGALVSHPAANFSEAHSYLDVLLYYLGIDYTLEVSESPIFMHGRCGKVVSNGVELGLIGEVRPEVLERREITMPCAAFEINLDRILAIKAV